jgi:hypothetical protein
MSASHARGSRGIDEFSRFLDSPTQVRVARCAQLNEVDPTPKQRLRCRQKARYASARSAFGMSSNSPRRVDVARVLAEVAAGR